MKKKKLVPFGIMPAAWGLKGKSRQIAEAEYYYTGRDLEFRLAEIEYADDPFMLEHEQTRIKQRYDSGPEHQPDVWEIEFLEIKRRHGKISQEEYQEQLDDIQLKHGQITPEDHARSRLARELESGAITQQEHDLEVLILERDRGEMTEHEYNKQRANILDEPYVNVLEMGVSPENVAQGYIELDWNDAFVKMLQDNGIRGTSDEDVVNRWFNSLCRSVLIQEIADMDFGLENSDPTADDETLEQTGRPDVLRRTNPGSEDPKGTDESSS